MQISATDKTLDAQKKTQNEKQKHCDTRGGFPILYAVQKPECQLEFGVLEKEWNQNNTLFRPHSTTATSMIAI